MTNPPARRLMPAPLPMATPDIPATGSLLPNIREAQQNLTSGENPKLLQLSPIHNCLCDNIRIYVPNNTQGLTLRFLVTAHCGKDGHRGASVTKSHILPHFTWSRLHNDVSAFCNGSPHCVTTSGGIRLPRPYIHRMHAEKSNELLHVDYLYIGDGEEGLKYILILTDYFSNYVWVRCTKTCGAETTVQDLLEWFATFALVPTWNSEQESHFKNELLTYLASALHTKHNVTTAYDRSLTVPLR